MWNKYSGQSVRGSIAFRGTTAASHMIVQTVYGNIIKLREPPKGSPTNFWPKGQEG
jgi:hypothetical protein